MDKNQPRVSAARRKAEAMLGQTQQKWDGGIKQERERESDALATKTARLRSLRLAKEEADRKSAALAPKPAKPRRRPAK